MDIGKCGLYRYATDPSFEILLIAWATDEGDGFGETRCADLASGEPLPKELLEDFQSGNVRLIAHNASFERVCFSVHLQRHLPGQYLKPGEFLSPDSWICTMVMAASLTLPMALKDLLGAMVTEAETRCRELQESMEAAQTAYDEGKTVLASLNAQYDEIISWSELYDTASIEAKKMIVSSLIRRVDVYRGYKLHIEVHHRL